MSQHDKRQEFWVADDIVMPLVVTRTNPGKYSHQWIHVREVLPGEISITREEFRDICMNRNCQDWHDLERELFGRLPEGQRDGE